MGLTVLIDLFYAMGVALSPTPVLLAIAMLFSGHTRRNALGFLAGWSSGLVLMFFVLLGLARAEILFLQTDTMSHPLVTVLMGIGLVWFGRRQWTRHGSDSKSEVPEWVNGLEQRFKTSKLVTPLRALVIGFLVAVVSPKNIVLMLAAVYAITEASLNELDTLILILLFVVTSSVTVGAPVLYAVARGDAAEPTLEAWKTQVLENRKRFTAALLFLFGIFLIVKGTGALVTLWLAAPA